MRRKIPLVDLGAQYDAHQSEIDAAIARVISAASFIGGPEVAAFEREFADFCEVSECATCNSGTDALALALEGLGVGPGDEVITVSMTFIATAEAISMVGARPVFVDVESDTLLMDVSRLEAAITPKTKAVLPVHLYGQMVDMEPLITIAKAHDLAVVEDCAQAHGARQRGRCAGSFGDAAAFSFYPGKNLGAYGDGGAVVSNDAALCSWIRQARDHGRSSKYEHAFEGRSSRLDGLQAAVLRAKLPHLDRWSKDRRALALRYDEQLADADRVRPVVSRPHNEPVFHLYVVQLPERDRSLQQLRKSGVGAGIHYPIPLHLQPAFATLHQGIGSFPITEKAAKSVLSLPLFPELSESDQAYVAEALLRVS